MMARRTMVMHIATNDGNVGTTHDHTSGDVLSTNQEKHKHKELGSLAVIMVSFHGIDEERVTDRIVFFVFVL